MKEKEYKKILDLLQEDQNNIKMFFDKKITLEEMKIKNEEISKEFKDFVRDNGFPFKNIVSEEIYKASIALSLHLPIADLKDMFEMINNLDSDKFSLSDKAFFIDKIRIADGKPQLYGTQTRRSENNEICLVEVEDEENLEKRRLGVGLESMSEYLKKFRK
jgi:hypothetical protein